IAGRAGGVKHEGDQALLAGGYCGRRSRKKVVLPRFRRGSATPRFQSEGSNLLLDAVFVDFEVGGGQIDNRLAVAIGYGRIDDDLFAPYPNRLIRGRSLRSHVLLR